MSNTKRKPVADQEEHSEDQQLSAYYELVNCVVEGLLEQLHIMGKTESVNESYLKAKLLYNAANTIGAGINMLPGHPTYDEWVDTHASGSLGEYYSTLRVVDD